METYRGVPAEATNKQFAETNSRHDWATQKQTLVHQKAPRWVEPSSGLSDNHWTRGRDNPRRVRDMSLAEERGTNLVQGHGKNPVEGRMARWNLCRTSTAPRA